MCQPSLPPVDCHILHLLRLICHRNRCTALRKRALLESNFENRLSFVEESRLFSSYSCLGKKLCLWKESRFPKKGWQQLSFFSKEHHFSSRKALFQTALPWRVTSKWNGAPERAELQTIKQLSKESHFGSLFFPVCAWCTISSFRAAATHSRSVYIFNLQQRCGMWITYGQWLYPQTLIRESYTQQPLIITQLEPVNLTNHITPQMLQLHNMFTWLETILWNWSSVDVSRNQLFVAPS